MSGNTFTKAGWSFGIANTTGNPVRVSDVSVRGTRDTGIDVGTAIPSVVERCNTDTCGGGGISAQIVTGCVARKSAGGGIFTGFNPAGRVTGSYGESLGSADGIFADGGLVVQCFGISASGNGISGTTVADSQGSSTTGSGIMATYAANNCTGFSTDSAGIFVLGAATNCSGTSENSTGVFARTATNCHASSTSGTGLLVVTVAQNCTGFSLLGRGLVAESASNCYGSTSQGTFGMEIAGTASFCRGSKPTGTAIKAAIAIGCTTDGGSVLAPQKHLGTP